jgi:hypothetical protein
MPPFTLLRRLIDIWLGQRPIAPDLAAAVADPATPWPRLVGLSAAHVMTPALAAAVADPIVAGGLPDDLRAFLEAIHDAATLRNQRLRAQLVHVATVLNEVSVVPVALKGAIRLVDGLWPDIALRFMHDLDLLVPADELARGQQRLVAEGWRVIGTLEEGDGHHVVLAHPEAEARVELHRIPLTAPHEALLPATRMLARARPLLLGDATVAVPALDDQLVHLVAHGMVQHAFLYNGRFVLRDLVEQALLVRLAEPQVLTRARARFTAAGLSRAWDVSMALGARCLPDSAIGPAHIDAATRLLVGRMLLQQRSPALMQLLGPLGWAVARGFGHVAACPAVAAGQPVLRQLTYRLQVFRRKTRW